MKIVLAGVIRNGQLLQLKADKEWVFQSVTMDEAVSLADLLDAKHQPQQAQH